MRDPKRIRPLLQRLAVVWSTMPDMRLGQLLEAACGCRLGAGPDLFNIEDEQLLKQAEDLLRAKQSR